MGTGISYSECRECGTKSGKNLLPIMWDEIKDAMMPFACFIVGVFAFPIILWRLIARYFNNK